MKASLWLGLIGLFIMLNGWRDIRNGNAQDERQALYAAEGRTVQGEVVSQVKTTYESGGRPGRSKTIHTVYRLGVNFKLPNGIPVSTGLSVDQPVSPSADGKTWITLRYLPSDPQASAEIEGRITYQPDDDSQNDQSGLIWLGMGAIPLGIACLRERAKLAKLFGRRS